MRYFSPWLTQLSCQIDSRFESLNSRKLISLSDHCKHEWYFQDFPERELESLQNTYGNFFNIQACTNRETNRALRIRTQFEACI